MITMYSVFSSIWIGIEIISTVLLIYLTAVLLNSKQRLFKSAFFRIFIATSISDIVSVFWHMSLRHILFNRDGCVQYFGARNYSLLYKSLYYGSSVLLTSHLCLTLLISLNRCTSVASPIIHERLWCPRNTMIAIVSQCLIGIPAWVFIMFSSDAVVVGEDGKFVFVDLDAWVRSLFHAAGGVMIMSRTTACLVMSVYTVRKLFKATGTVQHTNTERKLCFHAVFVFIGSFIMVFQQFIKMYAAYTSNDVLSMWIAEQFFWIHDMVIFTNLYSIIFCCSHVRTFFLPKKYFHVQIISSHSAHSNIPTITTSNFAH